MRFNFLFRLDIEDLQLPCRFTPVY
jgi:hypothetical protein